MTIIQTPPPLSTLKHHPRTFDSGFVGNPTSTNDGVDGSHNRPFHVSRQRDFNGSRLPSTSVNTGKNSHVYCLLTSSTLEGPRPRPHRHLLPSSGPPGDEVGIVYQSVQRGSLYNMGHCGTWVTVQPLLMFPDRENGITPYRDVSGSQGYPNRFRNQR